MGIGLYTRISEDLDGAGLGVTRQEADCRKLASLRGWTVAGVYTDNDVSAFKVKIVRPEFERLLADLGSGAIDGVVVWDLDRFARQPTDLERAIKLFDDRPLVFATVQGDMDLSSPDGRTMARVMVAFANKSSMDTSRRVKRKHLELSRTGVPVGGNRPFGWQADRRTLDHREAELVRQAAGDILAGLGLHTIARRWNDAGIRTTVGNPWRRGVLRQMLLSPRLAGFRVYHGRKALDENGEPVRGLFEAVLDEVTWEAVVAVITEPARVTRHVHIGGRKYLLSGIVRCGSCGALMHGNADTKWGTFSYACKLPTSGGGCGKVSITGPRLNEMITGLVSGYLSDVEVQRTATPWPRETELGQARRRVAELMTAYSNGTLSSDVVFPAVHRLEKMIDDLADDRADWLRRQVAVTNRPADVEADWPTLAIEQRRAIIQSVLEAVVVKPAAKRGGRFDPTRVEVVWRQ